MTAAPRTDDRAYWHALRYYSGAWRARHGTDMVAMMMDAADAGDDPLGPAGRRRLLWSGLGQRFASRPWLSWSATLGVASLVLYEFGAMRLRLGEAAPSEWLVTIGAAVLFLAAILVLTVSALHVPPLPDRPVRPARWGWTAWLVFVLSASRLLPLAPLGSVATLVAGALLYRRTREPQYRALAALSAAWIAVAALLVLPGATASTLCQLGVRSVC